MIVGSDKEKKKEEENPAKEDEKAMGALEQLLGGERHEIRTIGLIGDVDEEKGGDLMMGLLLLTELSGKEAPYDPITMYISTYGGSADEMFGIYDIMTKAKKQCEIHTIGVGKVMSAGTLVLASGTKGKRRIGSSISLPRREAVITESRVPSELNPKVPVKRTNPNSIQSLTSISYKTRQRGIKRIWEISKKSVVANILPRKRMLRSVGDMSSPPMQPVSIS